LQKLLDKADVDYDAEAVFEPSSFLPSWRQVS
jgi:hypothetical protein